MKYLITPFVVKRLYINHGVWR